MVYKYFPPNLTNVTALPCETQMFSIVQRWYVLIATNHLMAELAHSKLNMVYLAELLVVMTDWLKSVTVHAWNVPGIHRRLDDDAFLASLSCSRKVTVSRARCAGVPSCWNIKNHLWTTFQWSLRKKVVVTVCPLNFDTKFEQSDCNKFGIR